MKTQKFFLHQQYQSRNKSVQSSTLVERWEVILFHHTFLKQNAFEKQTCLIHLIHMYLL